MCTPHLSASTHLVPALACPPPTKHRPTSHHRKRNMQHTTALVLQLALIANPCTGAPTTPRPLAPPTPHPPRDTLRDIGACPHSLPGGCSQGQEAETNKTYRSEGLDLDLMWPVCPFLKLHQRGPCHFLGCRLVLKRIVSTESSPRTRGGVILIHWQPVESVWLLSVAGQRSPQLNEGVMRLPKGMAYF